MIKNDTDLKNSTVSLKCSEGFKTAHQAEKAPSLKDLGLSRFEYEEIKYFVDVDSMLVVCYILFR